MYMPTLARFTSRDPLAEEGIPILGGLPEEVPTAGPTLKPYVYVSNDPINALDPSGLWELRYCPSPVLMPIRMPSGCISCTF